MTSMCASVAGNIKIIEISHLDKDAGEDMSADVPLMKRDGYGKGESINTLRHDIKTSLRFCGRKAEVSS